MKTPASPTPPASAATSDEIASIPADSTAWALDALNPADRAAFDAILATDPDLRSDAEAHRDFCRMMEKELAVSVPDDVRLDPEKLTSSSPVAAQKETKRPVLLWTAGLGLAAGLAVMLAAPSLMPKYSKSEAPLVAARTDGSHLIIPAAAPAEQVSADALRELRYKQNAVVGLPAEPVAPSDQVAAANPAAFGEYQRFPGHPATVEIGGVISPRDGWKSDREADGTKSGLDVAAQSGSALSSEQSLMKSPPTGTANSGLVNWGGQIGPKAFASVGTQPFTPAQGFNGANPTLGLEGVQSSGGAGVKGYGVGSGTGAGSGVGNATLASRDRARAEALGSIDTNWQTDAAAPPSSGPAPAKPATTAASPEFEGMGGEWGAWELQSVASVVTEESRTAGLRRRDALPSAPGSESYEAPPENAFLAPQQQPLSTFSIDVDTASYANVRRFLDQQTRPPLAAVRLEELINYFPYDYTPPAADSAQPFAVHVEMAGCPWSPQHRLARVAIKGKDMATDKRPASNLVFLVDVSGSMAAENKLPLVKQSLRLLMDRLTPEDRVAIVTYAGSSGVALPSTSVAEKSRILSVIDSLGAGGGTNGAGGIEAAYQQAVGGFIKGGVNRVILATDGDFNVGITGHDALQSLITEKAKSGVFLSVLGYGMGNLKDSTMEMLSDKGNGNYAYIDNLAEARKVLSEQASSTLVTIAKDVKIQIEFNPAVVQSYRLLGYENRLLAKEDFNNDKIDAGEIGAGHTVTALYELVPVGAKPPAPPVDGLKYQQPVTTPEPAPAVNPDAAASGETMTVKLRYKAPDGDTSQLIEVPVKDSGAAAEAASSEFRWATAVCGYGLKLKNSAHAGGLSWDMIRTLALGAKGADPHGYRGEFLSLIDKARGLVP